VTRSFQIKKMLVFPPIAEAVAKLGKTEVNGRLRSTRYGLVGGAVFGASLQGEFHKYRGDGVILGRLLGMTETSCILSVVPPWHFRDGLLWKLWPPNSRDYRIIY
jgi:long-subunit acyl-CoA synthetase (AMP-forming)